MRYSVFAFAALMGARLFNEATEGGEGSAGTEGTNNPAAEGTGTRIRPDLAGYQTSKSASGSSTKICGDTTSLALAGAELDETYAFVAKVTGVAEDVLRSKYSASNPGQQRMFLGNLIRPAMADAKSPMKDADKAKRIQEAFAAALPDFRKGIDARLAEAAKAVEAEKARKAQEKVDAKAKKDAEKAANKAKPADTTAAGPNDKGAAKAESKPAAARPAAPKAPAQPK